MPGTKSARHIVEAVLASYLSSQSELAGVNFYTGDSADTNVLPKAVVLCDSASLPNDIPDGLGNYSCGVRVTVFDSADDVTLATHRARCAAIAGAMQDLDLIQAAFVAGGDALCYDVTPNSEDEGVNERSWASVFSYNVLVVVNPQP
jgi:hypothetical protein